MIDLQRASPTPRPSVFDSVLDPILNGVKILKISSFGIPIPYSTLRGRKKGLWRYRVNKYRIICRIQNDILTILVLKVAKRDVVYDD